MYIYILTEFWDVSKPIDTHASWDNFNVNSNSAECSWESCLSAAAMAVCTSLCNESAKNTIQQKVCSVRLALNIRPDQQYQTIFYHLKQAFIAVNDFIGVYSGITLEYEHCVVIIFSSPQTQRHFCKHGYHQ